MDCPYGGMVTSPLVEEGPQLHECCYCLYTLRTIVRNGSLDFCQDDRFEFSKFEKIQTCHPDKSLDYHSLL